MFFLNIGYAAVTMSDIRITGYFYSTYENDDFCKIVLRRFCV